ncbi:unnamed protein product [Vitrella brassicaformis CCMP3155]|uniref:Uncharacterized protein n=2 Tax=Vitrella brassicaformis TaxID=1169539 RepID=A0A0G4GRT8_VITBC|nr:unnamed protein product [Vitrella brassicaformis CCMP3155]|eukprot:CEM33340.1 unnamed protein product [Vitrella brassicaformis CCMP3155]
MNGDAAAGTSSHPPAPPLPPEAPMPSSVATGGLSAAVAASSSANLMDGFGAPPSPNKDFVSLSPSSAKKRSRFDQKGAAGASGKPDDDTYDPVVGSSLPMSSPLASPPPSHAHTDDKSKRWASKWDQDANKQQPAANGHQPLTMTDSPPQPFKAPDRKADDPPKDNLSPSPAMDSRRIIRPIPKKKNAARRPSTGNAGKLSASQQTSSPDLTQSPGVARGSPKPNEMEVRRQEYEERERKRKLREVQKQRYRTNRSPGREQLEGASHSARSQESQEWKGRPDKRLRTGYPSLSSSGHSMGSGPVGRSVTGGGFPTDGGKSPPPLVELLEVAPVEPPPAPDMSGGAPKGPKTYYIRQGRMDWQYQLERSKQDNRELEEKREQLLKRKEDIEPDTRQELEAMDRKVRDLRIRNQELIKKREAAEAKAIEDRIALEKETADVKLAEKAVPEQHQPSIDEAKKKKRAAMAERAKADKKHKEEQESLDKVEKTIKKLKQLEQKLIGLRSRRHDKRRKAEQAKAKAAAAAPPPLPPPPPAQDAAAVPAAPAAAQTHEQPAAAPAPLSAAAEPSGPLPAGDVTMADAPPDGGGDGDARMAAAAGQKATAEEERAPPKAPEATPMDEESREGEGEKDAVPEEGEGTASGGAPPAPATANAEGKGGGDEGDAKPAEATDAAAAADADKMAD